MSPLFGRKTQSSAVDKDAFVDAMDALETYFALQKEVSARLSSGFWALAQTKYVMGADRVSPLAFPQRMRASRFVVESDDGALSLTSTKPRRTKEASGSSEKPVMVLPSSPSKADKVEGVSEQLRALALQYDSRFAKDLAEEGEEEEEEEEEEDSPPASPSSSKGDLAATKSPVRFFGNFVPPALRTAAEEFEAALQQALEALNARRKVEQALQKHASKVVSCGE